jgi:hypothetical protein
MAFFVGFQLPKLGILTMNVALEFHQIKLEIQHRKLGISAAEINIINLRRSCLHFLAGK